MPLVNSVLNGHKIDSIDIEDRGLHYGDGLFETMLYQHGKIALWPQHYARLKAGCFVLGLQLPNEQALLNDINTLMQKQKAASYIVKLLISRGAAGRGLRVDKTIPVTSLLLAYDYEIKKTFIHHLKVCNTRLLINKTLGGIKHLNRLLYVLAAAELDGQFSEGIMLNDKNEMIECMTHNLFFVKDNVLYTAPINDCGVAGIKRQQVLEMAKKLGVATCIKAIKINELKEMDECFITNAVVGLQSVASIDPVAFLQNSITLKLKESLS